MKSNTDLKSTTKNTVNLIKNLLGLFDNQLKENLLAGWKSWDILG